MATIPIPTSHREQNSFPKYHLQSRAGNICAPGLPGMPQPVLPFHPDVRIPKKRQDRAFPGYSASFSGSSGPQVLKVHRRIQTVCGIWFLVISSLVLSVFMLSCTPIAGSTGVSLALHFRIDPRFFSIEALSSPVIGPRGLDRGSRTIAPGESWTTSRYSISASGPEGAVFTKETKAESLTATLSPGSWEITVRALNASAKPVAIAHGTVLLEAGRSSNLNLEMLPVEGNGSLIVHLSSSLTPPAGSRITGNLSPVDGPAQLAGMPSLTTSFPIDIESEASAIEITDVPAGFYRLDLALADGRGSIAGTSETVLILAGFQTAGDCRLVLGAPGFALALNPVPMDPITDLVLPARHKASTLLAFCPELAGGKAGTTLIWKLNGSPAGSSTVTAASTVTPTALPLFTSAGNIDSSAMPSIVRLDVLARDPESGLQGSTGEIYEFVAGPKNSTLAWKALYEARATTGPSIFQGSTGSAPGTDTPAPVKAVAANRKPGIILAAGLDDSSSVHAFRITEHGQLFRLWKDKVTISTSKTPDRLAVSPSGTIAAAAGSASSWLRIYKLDGEGRKAAIWDFTSSSPGLAGLSYVKGLAFSPDSNRLYVLVNSPESLYTFLIPENAETAPVLEHRFDFDSLYPGTSLSMSGLAVGPDGSVSASSSGTSRVFILQQEASGMSLVQTIDKTLAGNDFTQPEALTFSTGVKDLYILCDRNSIKHMRREDTGSPYFLAGSLSLSPSFTDCTSLIFGHKDSDSAVFLLAAGGPGPVYIPVDGISGTPGNGTLLDPSGEDSFGLSGASGIVSADDILMLAGNSTSRSLSLLTILSP
ncbi:MAG: hypothetical protein Q8O15_11005 [Rectinemataceae bacterium]|nr:hypothetical protein [Rectinemataceae bacterium]